MAKKDAIVDDIAAFIKDPATQMDKKRPSVEDHALLGPKHCERAADYLKDNYVRADADQYRALSLSFQLSNLAISHGSKVLLKIRRACVLLDAMIRKDVRSSKAFGQIEDIDGESARKMLKSLVRIAATLQDRKTTRSDVSGEALHALFQDPLAFLEEKVVFVYGEPYAGQGDRNQTDFSFGYNERQDRYDFRQVRGVVPPGCETVRADSVVLRKWAQIPGVLVDGSNAEPDFSQLQGTELGARIMVTSQITGCAFAMKRADQKVYCAHIEPDGNLPGPALAEALRATGDFSNAEGGDDLAIYGRGYSHGTMNDSNRTGYMSNVGENRYVTVLGFQQDDRDYHIFSQEAQDNVVSKCQRIF